MLQQNFWSDSERHICKNNIEIVPKNYIRRIIGQIHNYLIKLLRRLLFDVHPHPHTNSVSSYLVSFPCWFATNSEELFRELLMSKRKIINTEMTIEYRLSIFLWKLYECTRNSQENNNSLGKVACHHDVLSIVLRYFSYYFCILFSFLCTKKSSRYLLLAVN